jgi:hypothetical protein
VVASVPASGDRHPAEFAAPDHERRIAHRRGPGFPIRPAPHPPRFTIVKSCRSGFPA